MPNPDELSVDAEDRSQNPWASSVKPSKQLCLDGSRGSDGYLCLQCRRINFHYALHRISKLGQTEAGDMVLYNRTGLDADCELCKLLAEYVLPGAYKEPPEFGSTTPWQLRAISIRAMFMPEISSCYFRPAPVAVFHAGCARNDYLKTIDSEKAERIGYLAFGRAQDLSDVSSGKLKAKGVPVETRLIGESYDPELVNCWLRYSQEGVDEIDGWQEEEDGDDESDDSDVEGVDSSKWEPSSSGSSGSTVGEDTSEILGQVADDQVTGSGLEIEGMKVIDCQTFDIIPRERDMKYLALSYVWSLAHTDMVPLKCQCAVRESPQRKSRDVSEHITHNSIAVHASSKPASSAFKASCQASPNCATNGTVHKAERKGLPSVIPKVVHNAIQVTTDLRYRYLWVDQFCIDQNGPKDEIATQISQMDLIYSSAEVTIIAASSAGALPGVGDTPRTKQVFVNLTSPDEVLDGPEHHITVFSTPPAPSMAISKTPWFSRGWCFQESVLSPCRLYFTDHQTVFDTERVRCFESYPRPHRLTGSMLNSDFEENPSLVCPASWDEMLAFIREHYAYTGTEYKPDDPREQFWTEMVKWKEVIKPYAVKHLTYDSDSINGFHGALKVFTRHDPHFQIIHGIPIFHVSELLIAALNDSHNNLNQFRDTLFALTLEWYHDSLPARRVDFPSWTWAGWKGHIGWRFRHRWRGTIPNDEFVPSITFQAVESSDGQFTDLGRARELHQSFFLIGECTLVPRTAFIFYHEWALLSKEERLKPHASWVADHPNADMLPAGAGLTKTMAASLKTGAWSCLLLSHSPPGQSYGWAELLVVEWDAVEPPHHYGHLGLRTCSRVGRLYVEYRGKENDPEFVSMCGIGPRIGFRLG